jgi:molecular chaperone HscA
MALLQISEPGMAPAPHQRRIAVGIDLGTTNSLVAAMRNSVAEVLPDEDGHYLLPSVVRYLEKGGRRIGRVAKEEAALDPRNTIVSVKRFMGRGKSEVEGAENAPYDFVDAPGMVQIRTIDGVKSPVEVSAESEEPRGSIGGNPGDVALSRGRFARRRPGWRGDHGPGLLR